jgi:hypothetical protein
MFDPVMVCSECGEPVVAKAVHLHPGRGARRESAGPGRRAGAKNHG